MSKILTIPFRRVIIILCFIDILAYPTLLIRRKKLMKMKKVLAVVMSLCMTTGVISYGAPFISQAITAQADVIEDSCYSFDEATGVLTLKGKVDGDTLRGLNYNFRIKVKSIVAEEGTVFPEDSHSLCWAFYYCTSIDLSNADTSNVKNMSQMFSGCNYVTNIDLSGFDTSNVTDMSYMFASCYALPKVNLSSFNTSKVKSMGCMFYSCYNLESIDLSSFDTNNVTIMGSMFNECYSLTSLDLSSFDTSNVTYMNNMFAYCSILTSLDLSGFDTSNVINMSLMFYECKSLTSLNLSNFNTSNADDMHMMFYGCSALTELDVSSFDTKKSWRIESIFENCSSLTSIDISGFDTSKILYPYNAQLFMGCSKLKTISLGENFNNIKSDAKLTNGEGWVNVKNPKTVVSGDDEYAVIKNSGKNTYKRLPIEEETKITYPTNIKVEYSEKYHQVRFTWDKVEGADRYGIAPKNLTPGRTYSVAIAARVNGKWDIANATKNAVIIVRIPNASLDKDGDGILNAKDNQPNHKNNYPSVLVDYINKGIVDMNYTEETVDDFVICKTPLSEILLSCGVNNLTDAGGTIYPVNGYYDDWYIMALNRNGKATYGLYKMREQEYDSYDNNDPGVTISFVEFDISKLNDVIYHNTSNTSDLYNEIDKVVRVSNSPYSSELQSYFVDVNSDAPYLIAEAYVDKIANSYSISSIPFPTQLNDIYSEIDNVNATINSITNSIYPNSLALDVLYEKRANLSRVPNALTDCNISFGSIIADENNKVIKISSSKNLDYNEKRAILSAYTADTSFNMFAAEVQAHADYLDDGLLSSIDKWYSSALRADMAIGEGYESGGFDSYYNPHNIRVVAQANVHGDY